MTHNNKVYMRKYNATEKGAKYNRMNSKRWRVGKKNNRSKYRGCISNEWREAILYYLINRDGLNCFYCKEVIVIPDFHISHKLSQRLGGPNRMENYCLAHPKCNMKDAIIVRKKVHGY